jgi:hypothetical protein
VAELATPLVREDGETLDAAKVAVTFLDVASSSPVARAASTTAASSTADLIPLPPRKPPECFGARLRGLCTRRSTPLARLLLSTGR